MCQKHNSKGIQLGERHIRIDNCMHPLISSLRHGLDSNVETVACCCGHGRDPPSVVVRYKDTNKHLDIFSGKEIPRTRNFYRKDNDGYYYIPEVVKS